MCIYLYIRLYVYAYIYLYSAAYTGTHLVVLISGHCYEIRLRENVRPKCAVVQFVHVVGSGDVEPWLIFVHGVENCLQETQKDKRNKYI